MTEPVGYGAFETTVDAVYRLAPEAERITDANSSTMPSAITEDTIRAWIVEVSDMLAGAIGDWSEIHDPTAAGRVIGAARSTVACGVASYLEAARYPTMAGQNTNSYAQTLWDRYMYGVTMLTTMVKDTIALAPDPDDGTTGLDSLGQPVGAFPPPYFVDGDPWWPWAEPADPRAMW